MSFYYFMSLDLEGLVPTEGGKPGESVTLLSDVHLHGHTPGHEAPDHNNRVGGVHWVLEGKDQ